MHIQLSPAAMSNLRRAASDRNQSSQEFVSQELEKILSAGSAYFVLNPIPPLERIRDMRLFCDEVSKMKVYYGFKFLNEQEASLLVSALKAQAETDQGEESDSNTSGGNVVSINQDKPETSNTAVDTNS